MKTSIYSKKITKYLRRKKKEFLLNFLPVNQTFISPLGFKMNLTLDKQVDKEIFMGIFESDTQNFYEGILQNGMIVFDIGANKGLYSLIAATKIGKEGRIYSFEPATKAHNSLLDNIKLNNYSNIYPFKLGISDKQGEIVFNICDDDAYNSIGNNPLKPVKEQQIIRITSIDFFCKEHNINKIDLLKIDTEGAEELVLKGGKTLLSNNNGPIIICEYNSKTNYGIANSEGMFTLLREMGYYIFQINSKELIYFDKSNYKSTEIICLKESHLRVFSEDIKSR